jgi:hypothetical protein
MKKFTMTALVALSLVGSSIKPVHAGAEVSIATVVGLVATMATVGMALTSGGAGVMRADMYQDAVDALALEDSSAITPALTSLIEEVRSNEPKLQEVDDLTILAALVELNQ